LDEGEGVMVGAGLEGVDQAAGSVVSDPDLEVVGAGLEGGGDAQAEGWFQKDAEGMAVYGDFGDFVWPKICQSGHSGKSLKLSKSMSIWLDNCPVMATKEKGRFLSSPFPLSFSHLKRYFKVRYLIILFLRTS
jgi:hypothetical protein